MDFEELELSTAGSAVTDVTRLLTTFCAGRGDGHCNAFAPHATAGLALIEVGDGSDDDLVEALKRLFPRDDRYVHRHGSVGHGADHLLPAIVSPSVTIPVKEGKPLLGVWQHLVFVDLNEDNPRRRLVFSFR